VRRVGAEHPPYGYGKTMQELGWLLQDMAGEPSEK